MIDWLIPAIVVLAVLGVGNLVLLLAVLRRLGVHEERIASMGPPGFDVTALVGRSTRLASGRERLVGFFSAGCDACVEQARKFALHHDSDRLALAVNELSTLAERDELLVALDGAPVVVREPESTSIAHALGISAYPVLLVVDGSGAVVQAGHSLAELTLPAASAR